MRARALLACALVLGALLLAAALVALRSILALAPLEIVLDGHQELVGVAVAADGTLYVADRGAGVVYRLALPGQLTVAVAGLDRPAGLALDPAGRLLIAEEKAGRVLRLEPYGTLSVLATGIKKPRWLAVSPDGAIYVSAHRLPSPSGANETEGREILQLVPGGSPTVVASGIRRLEGLARLNGALVAATKGFESEPESAGMLLRYPVLADGSPGAPLIWVDTGLKQPVGLVLDRLGAFYVSSKELAVGIDTAKRAVGKVHPDARLSAFAEHLEDPQGMALGPDGSLYLADGKAGRLLRFRAPPAPVLDALPAFTNQSPLPVGGITDPAARVDLFVNDAATPVTGASDVSGAFSLTVPLTPNAENSLHVFATTHAGDGLTSPPGAGHLTHDNTPPNTVITDGPTGTVSQTAVTFTVTGSDNFTPAGDLEFAWRLNVLDGGSNPFSSFTSATQFSLTGLSPGSYIFEVKARDLAGNESPVQRTFTVAALRIQITAPVADATLMPGLILVRGTVEAGGAEVGVVVNGVLAAVQGTTFVALVSVSPETTHLTAHATTAAGATATHSVAIRVASALEPTMALLPSPQSGVAPLTVAFSLLGGPVPTQVELDFDGNGTVDFTGPSLEGRTFTYAQPGLYVPRVTLTDARGIRLTASTVVQVFDPTILERLIQAKWQGMRDALRRGDTEGVLQAIAVGIRTRYRPALEALRGDLPTLAATLGDLQIIAFQDGLAEAATVRLEDGQRRVYFIYFVPDEDGIWRILGM